MTIMDTAIVWYQSRALWGMVAALLVATATHFGIGLPAGWDKDSITTFLLQGALICYSIYERVTANKIIASSSQKAAAINATTIKVSASDASMIKQVPTTLLQLMIVAPVIGLLGGAVLLSGCSTLGSPQTVGQGLFAAYGTFDAAVTGANTYAQAPGADKAVVHVLATAYRAAKPAADVVLAYKACVVAHQPSAVIDGVTFPCTGYNFSSANLLQIETTLRNAALTLQQTTPK